MVAVIVLFSTLSFGLGMLAQRDMNREGNGVYIEELPVAAAAVAPLGATPEAAAMAPADGAYVASKNGTRYYLPWCSGVKQIKEENKVWFKTKEEAAARGLTPAKNCPGI